MDAGRFPTRCGWLTLTRAQVETEGDVATAFTLARILTNVPPSRGGPTSLVVFDIHALQERFYFGDTVMPLFESGVPLLLEKLRSLPDQENVSVRPCRGGRAVVSPPHRVWACNSWAPCPTAHLMPVRLGVADPWVLGCLQWVLNHTGGVAQCGSAALA